MYCRELAEYRCTYIWSMVQVPVHYLLPVCGCAGPLERLASRVQLPLGTKI
jgi:hypothetical protein